jgi:hypothetical protein
MTYLQAAPTFLIGAITFIAVMSIFYIGYRARKVMVKRNPEHADTDLKAINGMMIGLLGLILAFTFGMSNSRFNSRRELIMQEVNTIGTTVLRTDIYPDSMRTLLRLKLQQYVDVRIAFYEVGMNIDSARILYDHGEVIAKDTWKIAASYARKDDITTRTSQLVPSLNAMIDVAATRKAAGEATIPDSIMYFLFILCLSSSFLLGYDQHGRIDWLVVTGFSLMLSVTIFNIIDLDRPRSGLINMDNANKKVVELRELFIDN